MSHLGANAGDGYGGNDVKIGFNRKNLLTRPDPLWDDQNNCPIRLTDTKNQEIHELSLDQEHTFAWRQKLKNRKAYDAAPPGAFKAPSAGIHVMELFCTEGSLSIERIVLRYNNKALPSGKGPAPTLKGTTALLNTPRAVSREVSKAGARRVFMGLGAQTQRVSEPVTKGYRVDMRGKRIHQAGQASAGIYVQF